MKFELVLFLYFWAAVANGNQAKIQLEADQPFQRVPVSQQASIECCYRCEEKLHFTWIMNVHTINRTTSLQIVNSSDKVTFKPIREANGVKCHELVLQNVQIEDTGLYQCFLNLTTPRIAIFTHGTFLQVYKPLQKTLDLSESVKNSIITAEGVLLLLCVLIPGTMLLCKSKRLKELDRKKGREEENIYEGLNLDDCNSTYHQIQRSHVQGPYQDVANCGDDIQLEKP
ncbi:B-cell antigen receptor complex-associated protein alpha chain [Misgurnus anguillicaudatus]|uniref:B-cell antigen receptor complex-associated protein alpha chain n=1 Tax=Misgurnus anguillicaudatus TaxID=75329 RepID=UPI003CCF92F0